MSRYEIADLEKELRAITSPEQYAADQEQERLKIDATGDILDPLAQVKHIPEFQEYQRQMRAFMPVRNGIFLRYFNKYKW